MVQVLKNGAVAATYGHDFRGQRVWRQIPGVGGSQTHYIFDTDGHLLAEQNPVTGKVVKEYVWLQDLRLALTTSTGALAWSGYLDPFRLKF